jgi:ribosomal protein L31
MKKNIHPKYNKIVVKIVGGATFETYSTMGKDGDPTIITIADPFTTHSAWRKDKANALNTSATKISDFERRFGMINVGSDNMISSRAEPKVANQEEN